MPLLKKYPKLLLLLCIYILTIFLFSFAGHYLEKILVNMGSVGIFISGLFYTYSFTGSIGTGAIILLAKTFDPLTIAVIGGIGAGIADISILRLIQKFGFLEELNHISKENFFIKLTKNVKFLTSKVFLTILGMITIASPLPDEIGVVLVNRGGLLSAKYFFGIAILLNGVGIYVIAILV